MDLVGSHETRNKFKLYIFFLIFIFFVTIIVLVLTFKVKLKIIPTENTINYYWSWINFDGKLLKKQNSCEAEPVWDMTFVSPELSSVITHSVRSMCMYVCMCMYVVFCKIDHCIHIHWCIVMGLGHNDPWVESHMWPQQTWGQRSSRGQWPLVQVFGKWVSVSTYFDLYFQI